VCATCGCSDDPDGGVRVIDPDHVPDPQHTHDHDHVPDPQHTHDHDHVHGPGHDHDHAHGPADTLGPAPSEESGEERPRGHTVSLEQRVLAKNDQLAERNRDWLTGRGILALNLMSSPGAGKTTLLERTITDLAGAPPVSVLEGDQETLLDAQRIRATGCRVVQINTGSGCHLDAEMVARGLRALAPPERSLLFVENVGNLVCPALFDLGEAAKIVIISVTEGDDKPLKYPHMFAAADLVLLNKVDLLPYVSFDVSRCLAAARRINPGVPVLEVSATRGDGLTDWYRWLRDRAGG
jgi:hydrogenase nickel incorporation protein HypB